ncbi:MAG: hypothetical protein HYY40_11075 [Bacteroidetes bacterium]|nr:hypothetical protein [Bacteroidota bacterium]
MLRQVLFFLLIFLFPVSVFAQYSWDFGGGLGATNYLGEMGGKDKPRRNFIYDMKLKQTRYDFSGFARYKFYPFLLLKGTMSYLRIVGADSLSIYDRRKYRNLHFRNSIIELIATAEYQFFKAYDITRKGKIRVDLQFYGFAGIGGVYHNPKAKSSLTGKWEALQPLGTEGQGVLPDKKKYGRFQPVVPFGIGLFYTIRRNYRVGLELNYRLTFTDYLDDASTTYPDPAIFTDPVAAELSNRSANTPRPDWYVKGSLRGNDKYNDTYMTLMLNASYVMRGKSNFYRSKYQFLISQRKKKRKTRAKF